MNAPVFPAPPSWSANLFTVGVTGTNGKTTTTALLAAALRTVGVTVYRNTTVGAYLDDEPLEATADYDGFIHGMNLCRERGGRFAAIECTSEALGLGFAKAWPCSIGVFTNFTRDHLDSHGSFEHYLASKAQLFMHLPRGGCAVLNGCDPACALIEEVVPSGTRVVRYGNVTRGAPAVALDLAITCVQTTWEGTSFDIETSEALRGLPSRIEIQLVGDMYAENAAASLVAAVMAGADPECAARAISLSSAPAGRFEVVGTGPRVVVDYAHTPDALARTLAVARRLCLGRLLVVFGAGGHRDRGKREGMGKAAACADRVILTSDNPRDEDPVAIVEAIRMGLADHGHVQVELDREAAICAAIAGAGSEDVVVVAGKGHEQDQDSNGQKHPFCDQDVARRMLGGNGDERSGR